MLLKQIDSKANGVDAARDAPKTEHQRLLSHPAPTALGDKNTRCPAIRHLHI
jgi:hypothetical protein